MFEKPFKDREEAKEQLKRCRRWCSISENLSFLLVIIAIIWRVLKIDFGLDSTFWFLLAIFFAICSVAPHLHIAEIQQMMGFESEHK
jgi:ABC-type transport system involved in cytochrome bd biosynthesis fused ATPase/permease subunit